MKRRTSTLGEARRRQLHSHAFAIYAMSQPSPAKASILFPTASPDATEAVVEIRNPVTAGALGYVALRPIGLSEMVQAVRRGSLTDCRQLANRLTFGAG